jgi:predicted RNA-binding protein with PIN domain
MAALVPGLPAKLNAVATVLVDGENVRRSLWPNMARDELERRAAAWGEENGHDVIVVWESSESADDTIARWVRELEAPVWVATSDRALRRRVADYAERIVGGGSFARQL